MTPTNPRLYTATLLAFDERLRVDLEAMTDYFTWLGDRGVEGVFVLGTTGEFVTLGEDERTAVIERAVAVFGQESVIAHIGAASLYQARRLLLRAREVGATRFAAITPFYQQAEPGALREYYVGLAQSSAGGELFAYLFECRTAAPVHPADLAGLAAAAGLTGAKVSGEPAETVISYLHACADGFQMLTGNDVTVAAVVRAGGAGAVSATSAVFPEPFVQQMAALRARDDAAADSAQSIVEAATAACEAGNLAVMKAALRMRGFDLGPCRVAVDVPDPDRLTRARALIETMVTK